MGLLWKDDAAYAINAAGLNKMVDVKPGLTNQYITANGAGTGAIIKANTIIALKSGSVWKAYHFGTDIEITMLDTGVLTLGTDYCVYLCDDGTDVGLVLISANTTAPSGYDATNSRKIGGFHYGRIRPIANRYSDIYLPAVQVVPNSVWDLRNRPRAPNPAGMAKVGSLWVDQYLASEDGGSWPETIPLSIYNATPLTGTEGYSYYEYMLLAANAGKRLPSFAEFIAYAYGAPAGHDADNDVAWSATTNTGRAATGSVANAVSCANIVDTTGNVWEVLADHFGGGVGEIWNNVANTGKDAGYAHGQVYYGDEAMKMLLAGGLWSNGVIAGARAATLSSAPWNVNTSIGLRCVSDPL